MYSSNQVEYAKEEVRYCSESSFMHLLFKRPAKNLAQEVANRKSLQEGFSEGEIMMIAFCTLQALREFRSLGQHKLAVK